MPGVRGPRAPAELRETHPRAAKAQMLARVVVPLVLQPLDKVEQNHVRGARPERGQLAGATGAARELVPATRIRVYTGAQRGAPDGTLWGAPRRAFGGRGR